MNSLLKKCALAAVFSLALGTTAKAAEPLSNSIPNTRLAGSETILIAEDSGPENDRQILNQLRMINRMIADYMETTDVAMELMQSPNSELRTMGQEMLTNSNGMIDKLMVMRQRLSDIHNDSKR
jgi:ABC-type glycerol-3-phosphate transport system substrate-binding protein